MNLIGVAGQIAAGKDVFSNYLLDKLNLDVYKTFLQRRDVWTETGEKKTATTLWSKGAFADGLKKVMMDAFNIDADFIEKWKRIDDTPPGFDMTVRKALQFVGDGFRKIKPLVWIDWTLNGNSPKVISDCRYRNELLAIKERGGVNILLYRPGFENDIDHPSENQIKQIIFELSERTSEELPSIHFPSDGPISPSNTRISKTIGGLIDLFIVNDGTIEDLYKKIDDIVIPYLKEKINANANG
jgi:hypothetical protein